MNNQKCETCRFWMAFSGSDGNGACRRYPPEWNVIANAATFPLTFASSWCGEYQDKEPEDGMRRD